MSLRVTDGIAEAIIDSLSEVRFLEVDLKELLCFSLLNFYSFLHLDSDKKCALSDRKFRFSVLKNIHF